MGVTVECDDCAQDIDLKREYLYCQGCHQNVTNLVEELEGEVENLKQRLENALKQLNTDIYET